MYHLVPVNVSYLRSLAMYYSKRMQQPLRQLLSERSKYKRSYFQRGCREWASTVTADRPRLLHKNSDSTFFSMFCCPRCGTLDSASEWAWQVIGSRSFPNGTVSFSCTGEAVCSVQQSPVWRLMLQQNRLLLLQLLLCYRYCSGLQTAKCFAPKALSIP